MFYPIFCWVSSIRKVIKRYIRGRNLYLKKYLIPTININNQHNNVILREGGKGWRVDNLKMFYISVSCQSPMSATQLSSSVSRMGGVSQSPGPVTERRTVWMPVMKGTVRQVILSSNFPSQNNNETFSESLRLFREQFVKVELNCIYFIWSRHDIHIFTAQQPSSFISIKLQTDRELLRSWLESWNRSRRV